LVGAPPFEAKTATLSPTCWNISGFTRSVPVLAPLWCRSSNGSSLERPAHLPAVLTELPDDLGVEVFSVSHWCLFLLVLEILLNQQDHR